MSIFNIGRFLPSIQIERPKPPPPPPAPVKAQQTGQPVDKFDDCEHHGRTSEGRHTNGGTADDSIGRNKGTPDDSIGRNKGTPDDSIGRNKDKGTPDDSIGGNVDPDQTRQTDGEKPTWLANRLPINRDGISDAASAQIDQCLNDENASKAAAAAYAFSTPAFAALAAPEREKFIALATKTDEEGTKTLARLAEKSGDALFETATDGTSTLDNLNKLADSPQAATYLNTALKDIANPDRIMQGQAPTCTVTSMQYELANDKPAEYARLITGLAMDGKVTMAGGGELVGTPGAALRRSALNHDDRSPTEAIFQNAAMEFANGTDTYNQALQQSAGVHDGKAVNYKGLYPDQIRDMIGQLFGTPYETREIQTDDQARIELTKLPSEMQPNRPVFFDIDFGSFNHNVSFLGIKDGNVLYHDPYTGKTERMPEDEFIKRATAIHVAKPEDPPEPKFLDVGSFMRNMDQMMMID